MCMCVESHTQFSVPLQQPTVSYPLFPADTSLRKLDGWAGYQVTTGSHLMGEQKYCCCI